MSDKPDFRTPLNLLSKEELIAEWRHWDKEVGLMPAFGSAMTFANECRANARAQLELRFPEVTIDELKNG